MNCVRKWCSERCHTDGDCESCMEYCAPRIRLSEATGCSEHLIWILQNQNGGVTHPHLADKIANYIGATPEERDMIVPEQHRGTFSPEHNRPKFGTVTSMWGGSNRREIVVIDRTATEITRIPSLRDAAKQYRCTNVTIANRCNRVGCAEDEFQPFGVAFRFAAEWDAMSQKERKQNLKQPRKVRHK